MSTQDEVWAGVAVDDTRGITGSLFRGTWTTCDDAAKEELKKNIDFKKITTSSELRWALTLTPECIHSELLVNTAMAQARRRHRRVRASG